MKEVPMFRIPLSVWTKRSFVASWSMRLSTAMAALLLGTLAADPAWAGPLFGIDARATAGASGSTVNEGKSVFKGGDGFRTVNTGPVVVNVNDGFGPNIITAEANASLGKVSAFASAIGADALANAEVGVEWFDTITPTSKDPKATEVTLKFTLSLFDTITHTGKVHPGITEGIAFAGLGGGLKLQDDLFNPLAVRTISTTETFPVGATFDLRFAASFTAEDFNGSSTTVDARDTAQFNLDPITPGGGYTTASGVSYLTPSAAAATPEPASLTLFALGGLCLLSRGRWK
jgi:hypothetical protein